MSKCKKCSCKSSFLLKCKCCNEYCTKHILPELHDCTEMETFKKEAYQKNEKKLIEATKKDKVDWII